MGLTVAEGRRRRGEGPKRVKWVAGAPPRPLYETCGGDWWVHYGLCSVPRLRILTWLCREGGEHLRPEMERALGMATYSALMGMRWCGLVSCHPMPLPAREKPRPDGIYKWLWSVTEEGRRYLWRYGWVTGRLVPATWDGVGFLGDEGADACEVLAREACPSLLRPTALATAHLLWMAGPLTVRRMAELLGLSRGAVQLYVRRWGALGWVEVAETVRDGYWRTHPECHRAWHWRFTRAGFSGLEGHAHALRWAAQQSGYAAPEDDRFLLGEDRTGWLSWEYTGALE